MGWIARAASLRGIFCGFDVSDLAPTPSAQFGRWFTFAGRVGVYMPNAMTLATASTDGRPSARMMLLKGCDEQGFVFYTNHESRKGHELAANPRAAIILHWVELHRQVRAEGTIVQLSREESTRYFHSRPRGSQVGAWASHQSTIVPSRKFLLDEFKELEKKFAGGPVPLPPHWGGFRLVPQSVEFWQGRAYRLHDRLRYERDGDTWKIVRLSP